MLLRVVGALLAFAFVLSALKLGSDWLASTDGITDPANRAEEIGRARTAVLAIFAGGLAAVGAYYTHRNFGLNRQGQITERFTRAVDQLGSESRDVRLGGVYALERIARESRDDHGPVVEILTAYVREHAPMVDEEEEERRLEFAPERYPEPPTADVQAALTVLGRRNTAHDPADPWKLDLTSVYLPRANLRYADLSGADLSFAVLTQADLSGAALWKTKMTRTRLFYADLSGAELGEADLTGALLTRAVLSGARMPGAKVSEARLDRARLQGAFMQSVNLDGADLQHADLIDANLEDASLVAADLRHALLSRTKLMWAELGGANLTDARYSPSTVWPDGFSADAAGAIAVKGK